MSASVDKTASDTRRRTPRRAALRQEAPVMLESRGWADYELIDSGAGAKLERYGRYRVVRPEAQALWTPRRPAAEWDRADARFVGSGDEDDGGGRWRFPKPLPDEWPMRYGSVAFLGRFTAFRHVGVFPEQEAHWSWLAERLGSTAGRPAEVLNLFGYTGIASLVAAAAGARVTHVDASKKSIAWARENQALSGLEDLPIRWICDDAMKFVRREERRERRYHGIILDPPKFGRGPKGEVWDIFEHLPELMAIVRRLLAPDASFVILSAYSIRASFLAVHELAAEALDGLGGVLQSGELVLRESGDGRRLSTSLFSRWAADHAA
jgi:23S rRNA (cytosine1962-C5)-methyltransferase